MPKLTQEEASKRLLSRGLKLLSDYEGSKNTVTVECPKCKQQLNARYDHLMTNHTRSCGCWTKPDLIGSKFGRWTVTGKTRNKHNQLMWECKCSCGTTRSVMASSLLRGISTSCGCYAIERISGSNGAQWKGHGDISGSIWVAIKCSAKNRKLRFEVGIEYAWDLFLEQDRRCAYTGIELFFGTSRKRNASLDRIDSSKPYIEGNVQWVHKTVNAMKWDMAEEEFLNWCDLVTRFMKTKIKSG